MDSRRIENLNEHLPYELLMLRYTHDQLNKTRHPLQWNAYLESFAVHARVLADFLTNKSGSNNFNARNFVDAFKVRKPTDLVGPMERLNRQIFHLGKNRTKETLEKFDLSNAKLVFEWIEAEFAKFLNSLSLDQRTYFADGRTAPSLAETPSSYLGGPTGAGPPAASTNPLTTSSSSTSVVSMPRLRK